MLKKCFGLLLFLTVLFCFSIAGFSASYKPEYKMSIVVGPTGPWGESAARFAEAVKAASNNRINIKPYYSGQLFAGKQTNEFLLMKQGVIDFALGSTINWSSSVRELNIFSLPFLFPDYRSLDAVEYGGTGTQIFRSMEEKGVKGLGWAENGFRDLTNSKRPVEKPEDLRGMKIRVVGSPIFIETFKAMGANPVSMNWGEALSAFQQKTVDGQENPVVSVIIPNKLWQVHKYMTVWNYAIDPIILGVSKQTWDAFDQKDKDMIKKVAEETAVWQKKRAREGLENSGAALDVLRKNGMEVAVLAPDQVKAFKDKTREVRDKWTRDIGVGLVKGAETEIQGTVRPQ